MNVYTNPQLFSIIVFGCVSNQLLNVGVNRGGVINVGCGYNLSNACSFAIAVGVIAFLLCLTFLVKDVLFVIIDYSDTIVVGADWEGGISFARVYLYLICTCML